MNVIKLNVIKIVVDGLPESCFKCRFVEHHEMYKSNCGINYKGAYSASRPEWCPLVVEDECVWEKFGRVYEGDYGWKTTYDLLDHPSLIVDIYDMDVNFKYCPHCGKRIRYEEQP